MNISDSSTPNEPSSEPNDEQIDRRPRIVGGPARQSPVRGPEFDPAIVPLPDAKIHNEPNSQVRPEQSDEPTEPKPLNVGGGSRFGRSTKASLKAMTLAATEISADAETHNDPSNHSESCIEQALVAPNSDLGGSTASPVTPTSEVPSTNFVQPSFPRCTGESPRAYSAFITFFQLGHKRSLPAVVEKLDESIDAIKRWSSRFSWNDRIHAFNAGILQQQAAAEAAAQQEEAAERAACMARFRRQQFAAAQKMLSVVEYYLETCDEEQLEKMTLGQVAQALKTSSTIGRLALSDSDLPDDEDSARSSLHIEFLNSLRRVYGEPSPTPPPPPQAATATNPNSKN